VGAGQSVRAALRGFAGHGSAGRSGHLRPVAPFSRNARLTPQPHREFRNALPDGPQASQRRTGSVCHKPTVQRDDHMQATADRRICFRFTTSTLRRQPALMMGRDAHGRGDLPLNARSAMSGVDRLRFDVSHRRSRCYEPTELCSCGSRLPTAVGVPRRSRSMVNASRGKS
jgi:hypothetical protein